mgnify:FL=1
MTKKTTEYDSFKFQYDTSIDGSEWDRIVVKGVIEYTRVHPDRGTWDSDFDYYGYNELGIVVIDWIELNDSEILLTDLKPEVRKDLISALDDYLDETFNLQ